MVGVLVGDEDSIDPLRFRAAQRVETVARNEGGTWRLYGEKWFCSNIDGAAIVLLARPEDGPDGAAGLGLYLVPRVLDDGSRVALEKSRVTHRFATRRQKIGPRLCQA